MTTWAPPPTIWLSAPQYIVLSAAAQVDAIAYEAARKISFGAGPSFRSEGVFGSLKARSYLEEVTLGYAITEMGREALAIGKVRKDAPKEGASPPVRPPPAVVAARKRTDRWLAAMDRERTLSEATA